MSTDVYFSEQVVHYGHKDATYYGFRVSTSSDGGETFPFRDAAQRDRWVALFAPFFPGDEWEARAAAGLFSLAEFGSDGDREPWGYVTDQRYPDLDRERLDEAIEAWKEAEL